MLSSSEGRAVAEGDNADDTDVLHTHKVHLERYVHDVCSDLKGSDRFKTLKSTFSDWVINQLITKLE